MNNCMECDKNETNNVPAVCDLCRTARFPEQFVLPLNVPGPNINIEEELLRKMRDTIDRILMIGKV